MSSWSFGASVPPDVAHIESNPALAHSGSGYLHVSRTTCDPLSTDVASTTLSFPPSPSSAEITAVRFFYMRPAATGARYVANGNSLPQALTWTEKILCYYQSSGFVQNLVFSNWALCTGSFSPDDLYVDDVSVTTVPTCPAG